MFLCLVLHNFVSNTTDSTISIKGILYPYEMGMILEVIVFELLFLLFGNLSWNCHPNNIALLYIGVIQS